MAERVRRRCQVCHRAEVVGLRRICRPCSHPLVRDVTAQMCDLQLEDSSSQSDSKSTLCSSNEDSSSTKDLHNQQEVVASLPAPLPDPYPLSSSSDVDIAVFDALCLHDESSASDCASVNLSGESSCSDCAPVDLHDESSSSDNASLEMSDEEFIPELDSAVIPLLHCRFPNPAVLCIRQSYSTMVCWKEKMHVFGSVSMLGGGASLQILVPAQEVLSLYLSTRSALEHHSPLARQLPPVWRDKSDQITVTGDLNPFLHALGRETPSVLYSRGSKHPFGPSSLVNEFLQVVLPDVQPSNIPEAWDNVKLPTTTRLDWSFTFVKHPPWCRWTESAGDEVVDLIEEEGFSVVFRQRYRYHYGIRDSETTTIRYRNTGWPRQQYGEVLLYYHNSAFYRNVPEMSFSLTESCFLSAEDREVTNMSSSEESLETMMMLAGSINDGLMPRVECRMFAPGRSVHQQNVSLFNKLLPALSSTLENSSPPADQPPPSTFFSTLLGRIKTLWTTSNDDVLAQLLSDDVLNILFHGLRQEEGFRLFDFVSLDKFCAAALNPHCTGQIEKDLTSFYREECHPHITSNVMYFLHKESLTLLRRALSLSAFSPKETASAQWLSFLPILMRSVLVPQLFADIYLVAAKTEENNSTLRHSWTEVPSEFGSFYVRRAFDSPDTTTFVEYIKNKAWNELPGSHCLRKRPSGGNILCLSLEAWCKQVAVFSLNQDRVRATFGRAFVSFTMMWNILLRLGVSTLGPVEAESYVQLLYEAVKELELPCLPLLTETGWHRVHTQGGNCFVWAPVPDDSASDIVDRVLPIGVSGAVGEIFAKLSWSVKFKYHILSQEYLDGRQFSLHIQAKGMNDHLVSFWPTVEANRAILLSQPDRLVSLLRKGPRWLKGPECRGRVMGRRALAYLCYCAGLVICVEPGQFTKRFRKDLLIETLIFTHCSDFAKGPLIIDPLLLKDFIDEHEAEDSIGELNLQKV